METYKVKPGDKAIYPDGTVHTFVKFGEVMTEPKKKPVSLKDAVAGNSERLSQHDNRMDAQSRTIDRITDRLYTLESVATCTRSMRDQQFDDYENRIRKLEQQHCNHDFEIVDGCVSVQNRLVYDPWPRVKPRTIKVRCVRCGLTVDRPLDVAEEPKKLSAWKRFTLFFRWGND